MLRINKLQKQRYHALWKDANLNVKKTVRMPIIDLNILNLMDGRPILTYKTLTIQPSIIRMLELRAASEKCTRHELLEYCMTIGQQYIISDNYITDRYGLNP